MEEQDIIQMEQRRQAIHLLGKCLKMQQLLIKTFRDGVYLTEVSLVIFQLAQL